jgi:cellulose synthase/poly-beta-1,6-N-acetylglucosamine synthase-like glycosyltransferase
MRGALGPFANTLAVLAVSITGWAVAAQLGLLASGSRILIFLIANLILSFDMVDLVVRVWLKRLHGATTLGPSTDLALPEISNTERAFLLSPYAVIASIHNEADEIDRFLQALLPFKDVVWLIDDASDDGTSLRLRRDGWNCIAGTVNRKKPGALANLLKSLPSEVETVVILDPDTRWTAAAGSERPTLERVISDLQRSGAAALTPRVQAARGGWLVECQALEYELAFGLGRKSLRDLTPNSGISIYRRSALEDALARHSLSVYAEDLENSLLLLARGERIYYDDRLRVETQVKQTWKSLFSQRVGWSFGCANLFVTRLAQLVTIARRSPLGAYQYIVYLGLNGIVLLPLKLVSTGILAFSFLKAVDDLLMTELLPGCCWNDPLLFALWYLKSTLVLLIACVAALPRGERSRHLATLPFYGVYALLLYLPMAVGYLNVLTLRLVGRRIYSDHYDANPAIAGRSAVGVSVWSP